MFTLYKSQTVEVHPRQNSQGLRNYCPEIPPKIDMDFRPSLSIQVIIHSLISSKSAMKGMFEQSKALLALPPLKVPVL